MIVGSLLLILVAVVLLVLGLTDGSSLLLTGSIAASLLAAVALVVGARQDSAAGEEFVDGTPGDETPDGDEAAEQNRQYAMSGARSGGSGQGGLYPTPESATVTLPAQPSGRAGYGTPPPGDTYAGQRDTGPRDAGWDEPGSSTQTVPVAPAQPATQAQPAAQAQAATPTDAGQPDREDAEFGDEDPPDEPAPQVVSAVDAARIARMTTDVLVIDGRPRYHLPGCVHLLGRESEPLPVGEAVELGFTPCSLCEPDSALLTDPRQR